MAENFLEFIDDGFIFAEIFQIAFAERFDADFISNSFVIKDNVTKKFFFVSFRPNFKAFFDSMSVAVKILTAGDACG